jgi:hypothetical protein
VGDIHCVVVADLDETDAVLSDGADVAEALSACTALPSRADDGVDESLGKDRTGVLEGAQDQS